MPLLSKSGARRNVGIPDIITCPALPGLFLCVVFDCCFLFVFVVFFDFVFFMCYAVCVNSLFTTKGVLMKNVKNAIFGIGFLGLLSLGACSSVSPLVGVDPALSGGQDWKFSAKETSEGVAETIKVYVTDNGVETKLGEVGLNMVKSSGNIETTYKGKPISVQCRAVDTGGSSNDSCIVYVSGKRGPKLRL